MTARRRFYELLDRNESGGRLARLLHGVLILTVIVSVASSIIDSIPEVDSAYDIIFDRIETVSLVVFGVEYLLRIWIAPENPIYQASGAFMARLSWTMSLAGVLDLMAIAPFLISKMTDVDLRVLVLLRLLRFFKVARYSPGFQSLVDAVRAERHALGACVLILMAVILLSAGLMHAAEHDAQPDKFRSIPDAMYWAATTVTTVGYGDVTPVTGLGKLVAVATMMAGLLMFALPAGIIATSFASTIARRNFVVTAAMVARMPLFAGVEASAIINLLPSITTRSYESGQRVLHRGEAADALYLITEGQMIEERGRHTRLLRVGDAFGAVKRTRSGMLASGRVRLLVIEAHDVNMLLHSVDGFADRIAQLHEGRP